MKKKLLTLLAFVMGTMTAGAFTLTTGTSEHGTLEFQVGGTAVTTADEGDVVTVICTPATGYVANQPSGEWSAGAALARRVQSGIGFLEPDFTLTPVEGEENQWTFTMEAANATVSMSYKKLLSNTDISIADITALTYTGQALTPTVTVQDGSTVLTLNTDYTVTYSNNVNVGTATATVTCGVCGDELTLNATVTSETTPATATEPGEIVYTATVELEGVPFTDTKTEEIPMLQPIEDENLRLTGLITADIEMCASFVFRRAVVVNSGYESFWVDVTKKGETVRFEVDGENPLVFDTARNRYSASYYQITAVEMAEPITAVLYAMDANGQVFCGSPVELAVRDTLVFNMMNSSSEEMRKMSADMLIYGGEAQRTFGSEYPPVDEDLTADQLQVLNDVKTQENPALTQTNSKISDDSGVLLALGVSMQSRVELALTVRGAGSAESVKIVIRDHASGDLIEKIDAAKAGVSYRATYNNIGSSNVHRQFELRAEVDGVEKGDIQIWSLEGFAKGYQDSTDPALQQQYVMAMATLRYCDSVGEYLASLEGNAE